METMTAVAALRAIVPPVSGERSRAADGELMRRVAAGDAAACRFVADRHLDGIVRFAYRMLGNQADAEDVAQEAFMRLWQTSKRWKPNALIKTWLHRVAHNLAIDRLRLRKPSEAVEDAGLSDAGPGPGGHLQRDQVARIVDAAIAALPDRQRAALALVHYEEMSNIDAAKIMGVSVEAIESLLARARRALRASLSERRADLLGEP